MSRGNQREVDRQRAQSRNSKKNGKTKDDGLTPEQRRERDAKALQEKAARKAAQAAGGGNAGGKTNKKYDVAPCNYCFHGPCIHQLGAIWPQVLAGRVKIEVEGETSLSFLSLHWCFPLGSLSLFSF